MMSKKTSFVGFRARVDEREKLERLSMATGQDFSTILRTLVHNAAIEPVQSFRVVSGKTNSQSAVLADVGAMAVNV